MKSTKLKVLFVAASFFAFSATFAQDTTNKPKPDTSKSPKPDSTVIKTTNGTSTLGSNTSTVNPVTPAVPKTGDTKVAAKKEETK